MPWEQGGGRKKKKRRWVLAFLPSGFVAQIFSGVLLACTYYVLVKSRLSKHLCRGLYLSVDVSQIKRDQHWLPSAEVWCHNSVISPWKFWKKVWEKKAHFFWRVPWQKLSPLDTNCKSGNKGCAAVECCLSSCPSRSKGPSCHDTLKTFPWAKMCARHKVQMARWPPHRKNLVL